MTNLHQWADSIGLEIDWRDDWGVGSHVAEFGDDYEHEPRECLSCAIRSADGDILASLGCIDDPSDDYAREIERELLEEVAENVGRSHPRDIALIPARELVA